VQKPGCIDTGCSKRLPARPQQVKDRGVPEGYVEGLNDARMKLADFFSSLLGWEERAPTEDSIGTAEISAGLQASQSSWACTPSQRSIP
jgi:hypothetical protein